MAKKKTKRVNNEENINTLLKNAAASERNPAASVCGSCGGPRDNDAMPCLNCATSERDSA